MNEAANPLWQGWLERLSILKQDRAVVSGQWSVGRWGRLCTI
jgi:hypothetical protein